MDAGVLMTHSAFLRRLARELMSCSADAEDAVQEVYVEALARPPRTLVRRQRQPHPVAHREAAWAGWALVLRRARP